MTRDEIINAAEELAIWLELQKNEAAAWIIRSLIALVPKKGMVVVPEEPTDKMIMACDYCHTGFAKQLYIDMLKAAKEGK